MTRLLLVNLLVLGSVALAVYLVAVLLHLLERAVGRFVSHRLGWRVVLVTGWIGVPVHELSHLLAAVLFRHRIVGWRLFEPDPATGTLGYVRHAHRRPTWYQLAGGFFIGLAPLVGGALVLTALLCWMVPPTRLLGLLTESGLIASSLTASGLTASSLTSGGLTASSVTTGGLTAGGLNVAEATTQELSVVGLLLATAKSLGALSLGLVAELWRDRTWWLPLQLYLGVAVAAHLAPSPRDLAGGLRGGLWLTGLLLAGAAATAYFEISMAPAMVVLPLLGLLVTVTALFQALYVLTVAGITAVIGRR